MTVWYYVCSCGAGDFFEAPAEQEPEQIDEHVRLLHGRENGGKPHRIRVRRVPPELAAFIRERQGRPSPSDRQTAER